MLMVSTMSAFRTLIIVLCIFLLLVAAKETKKKHLKSVKQSSSKQTITVGKGTSFLTGDNLKIKKKSTSCKLEGSNGKTKSGKCLKVQSTALPNHDVGPWCNGGETYTLLTHALTNHLIHPPTYHFHTPHPNHTPRWEMG